MARAWRAPDRHRGGRARRPVGARGERTGRGGMARESRSNDRRSPKSPHGGGRSPGGLAIWAGPVCDADGRPRRPGAGQPFRAEPLARGAASRFSGRGGAVQRVGHRARWPGAAGVRPAGSSGSRRRRSCRSTSPTPSWRCFSARGSSSGTPWRSPRRGSATGRGPRGWRAARRPSRLGWGASPSRAPSGPGRRPARSRSPIPSVGAIRSPGGRRSGPPCAGVGLGGLGPAQPPADGPRHRAPGHLTSRVSSAGPRTGPPGSTRSPPALGPSRISTPTG